MPVRCVRRGPSALAGDASYFCFTRARANTRFELGSATDRRLTRLLGGREVRSEDRRMLLSFA
jgi:hypothetical protein